jgi:geranylgeranyl reductase family protein
MRCYDAIIVGAGPAGSRAARLLAGDGLEVLLLEKEELPRHKTCAGGLTKRALAEADIPIEGLVERWVHGSLCRFNAQQEVTIVREEAPAVAMVMRDRFDHALVRAAREAGAEVIQRTRVSAVEEGAREVRIRTSRGTFLGHYLIGADGAFSTVARSLELNVKTHFNPAVEAELHPPEGILAPPLRRLVFYDMGAVPGGYAWIFPKKDFYSVGLCSTMPSVRNVMSLYRRFVASQPWLQDCRVARFGGWRIPLGTRGGRIMTRRGLLAGDAAGCVDPLTGEGIAYALKSGRLAAKAIGKAIRSGGEPGIEPFQRTMEKEIYEDLRIASAFARFIYRFPGLASRLLFRDDRVVRYYFKLLDGEEDYRGIRRLACKNWWRLRLR